MSQTQKTSLDSRTLKYIWSKVKLYRRDLSIGVVLLVLTNALGTYLAWAMKDIVEGISKGQLEPVWKNIIIVLLATIIMAFIRTSSRVVLFGIGRRVEIDEKRDFFTHLLALDLTFFSAHRTGDLISRSTNDIQALRQMLGFGLLNLINLVWVYTLTIPLMLSLSWQLTVLVLLGYLPILFLVKTLSGRLEKYQKIAQETLGELSSFIEEDLNGIQVIKSYAQEWREKQIFLRLNDLYREVSTKLSQWRSLIWPLMELAEGISYFILVYYASQQALNIGTIASFLICLERLVFPMAITGWLVTIFQRGSVSIKRLDLVYEAKPSPALAGGTESIDFREPSLEAKKLNVTYNAGNDLVLQDLNFKLPKRGFVGIVGRIASGKSTLAKSILRLLEAESGELLLGGKNVLSLAEEPLRRALAYVPQEPFLFNRTVGENVSFGRGFSQEEIERVCTLCQIHPEIEHLNHGYATPVGERGVSLSGGQGQRLTLARALIGQPSLLVLDDALSSIDNQVALEILDGLREEMKGGLLILATHRLEALRQADQILVLKAGQLVACGKHSELLESSGDYRRLAKEEMFYNAGS